MNTNALRYEDANSRRIATMQPMPKPELPSFLRPVSDDADRALFHLLYEMEQQKTTTAKTTVNYLDHGKLKNAKLGTFIERGINVETLRGLKSLETEQDYLTRLEGLLTLEAVVDLFKFKKVSRFEQITPQLIAERRQRIQNNKADYTANPDWIVSYKAAQAAKYEGREARMEKKHAFCSAINAINTREEK